MAASGPAQSIFSQKLDRVAFTAYFLGAVVPLVALGLVVERFVLRTLNDRLATLGLIGMVSGIAVLSLVSYLVLRRTTHHSIDRMDADNRRLEALLRASSSLAGAQDGHDAAATAARCALELEDAAATFVVMRTDSAEPVVFESAGANATKLAQALARPLVDMAKLVMREGRPLLRGPDKGKKSSGPRIEAAAAVPLRAEEGNLGAVVAIHTQAGRSFDASQLGSLSTLAAQVAVSLHNADLRHAQRNFFSHVTEMLVSALDAHLGYHTGHGNRVAQLANRVGRQMELDEATMQRLHFAALLHDIGMLKFDRKMHMNPKACEKHTVIGGRMLGRIRLWQELAPLVHNHHERWDGTGYPDGLAGDSIPLESRIIALCDAFDTVTSDASYKVAMSFAEGVQEMKDSGGTQFDPRIVDAFGALVEQGVIDETTLSS